MTKQSPKKKPYQVTLHIGDAAYKAQGNTMYEALSKLKPKSYHGGMGRIEATVHGKMSAIPLKLTPTRLQHIFEKPVMLEVFAKKIEILL